MAHKFSVVKTFVLIAKKIHHADCGYYAAKIMFSARALPRTLLGEFTVLPKLPSWI